jgi:hypothetical protein
MYCDLHPTRGFMGSIAAVFTGGDKPAPVHIETSRPEPVVVADAVPPPPSAPKAEEPPKKKRGFWSRVFGVGKNKDEHDKARQQGSASAWSPFPSPKLSTA